MSVVKFFKKKKKLCSYICMLYGEIFHASYIALDFASRKSNYVF